MQNIPAIVLIVHYDPILVEGLEDALTILGLEPIVAWNLTSALQFLQEYPHYFSAVLFSLTLDDIKSAAFIREVRRIDSTLKIYVTSAYTPVQTKEKLESETVDGIIHKPFGINDLIELFK